MARRPHDFGLSIPGSTIAANASGLSFEKAIGSFKDYLSSEYGSKYLLTKSVTALTASDQICLKQFFALSSAELQVEKPEKPQIGDIYQEAKGLSVMTYTNKLEWKKAQEGLKPDWLIYSKSTNRLLLIEAKYGDTQGNAHIERAGARATPRFIECLNKLFEGRARFLYIFGGPMITARVGSTKDKIGKRGARKGQIVQTSAQRRYSSARYQRQIEVLFGGLKEYVLLWEQDGLQSLIQLFEDDIRVWLDEKP